MTKRLLQEDYITYQPENTTGVRKSMRIHNKSHPSLENSDATAQINRITDEDVNSEHIPLDCMDVDAQREATSIEISRISLLGRGGFAKVYKVQSTRTEKIYAAKKQLGVSSTAKKTSLHEERLLNECRCANVVQCLGSFTARGSAFLLLEYVGIDLHYVLSQTTEPLPIAMTRHIMRGVLSALQTIHSAGIIHKDVKPANVLVSATDATIKLTDFGVACRVDPEDCEGRSPQAFNLPYRAPELCLGSKTYRTEVDIWAAGCIFAELVLNRKLFADVPSDLAHLNNIISIVPPPPAEHWKHTLGQYMTFDASETIGLVAALGPTAQQAMGLSGVQLLAGLLDTSPRTRISAPQALQSSFWDSANTDQRLTAQVTRPVQDRYNTQSRTTQVAMKPKIYAFTSKVVL